MTSFLNSIGYNSWILPMLLLLPVVGAAGILAHGWLVPRTEKSMATVRAVAAVTPGS